MYTLKQTTKIISKVNRNKSDNLFGHPSGCLCAPLGTAFLCSVPKQHFQNMIRATESHFTEQS